MNKIKQFLALGLFSLAVLALPSVASAQWGGGRDNGPYGNNGYYRDIKGNLENLKRNAERFEKTTNRVNDRSGNGRWGNSTERIEDLADDFKKATKDLEKDYGKGRNLNNSRDEAQRVLELGNRIEQSMYNSRGGQLQNEWNMIRGDLNVVAQVYGLNYGGWGNRNQYPNNRNPNRNRNRNGDWRNRVPFPLPF